jgi:hypothetical protein
MNTTHTPGPWSAEIPANSILCRAKIFTARSGRHTVIAEVGFRQGPATLAFAENDANARLIAAAPELLSALVDAEFLMRQAGKIAGPMQDSFKRSAEDARAAIAHATA